MELVNTTDLDYFITEYENKKDDLVTIEEDINKFESSISSRISIGGIYGVMSWCAPKLYEEQAKRNLLITAWKNLLVKINFNGLATAQDKRFWEQVLESHDVPEFTEINIVENLKRYYQNPRETILRGLAEVFTKLDPFYKSHTKVGIGKKGLPKRIILHCFNYSWDRYNVPTSDKEQITDILNCIALLEGSKRYNSYDDDLKEFFKGNKSIKGCTLKIYSSTVHVIFAPSTLDKINLGLSEYFGEVLPDVDEHKTTKQQSTAVSKDLQFYPTPQNVIERILQNYHIEKTDRVLEPSCGDGVMLDEISKYTKKIDGFEVDYNRSAICRTKGYNVSNSNFLESIPKKQYNWVIMNPPFYGKHWVKHYEHAKKFLKKGGQMICILPASAFYDGHLKGITDRNSFKNSWNDLPFGSFRESGTNIETGYVYIRND